jgi:hypothetical protein
MPAGKGGYLAMEPVFGGLLTEAYCRQHKDERLDPSVLVARARDALEDGPLVQALDDMEVGGVLCVGGWCGWVAWVVWVIVAMAARSKHWAHAHSTTPVSNHPATQARLTGDEPRYESAAAFAADMEPVLEVLESARELPEQLALAKDLRSRLDALTSAIEGRGGGAPLVGGAGARVHSSGGGGGTGAGDDAGSVGAKRSRGAGGRGGRRGKGKRRRGGAAVAGTA